MRKRQFKIFHDCGMYNVKERKWLFGIIPYWKDYWGLYRTISHARLSIRLLNGEEVT